MHSPAPRAPRRPRLAALTASVLAALALIAVLAAPANAATVRVPVDNKPVTTSGCGFDVLVTPIFDNEMLTETIVDGTIIDRITGRLVNSFTNVATGETIVRNVSGPNTTTITPDGTLTLEGTGNNWFGIGPNGQQNTGEPGLVVTSGHVVVTVDLTLRPPTVIGFSLHGTQENLCAILAP